MYSLSKLVAILGGLHHTRLEKIKVSSTIGLTFDELESLDMALDRAVAPKRATFAPREFERIQYGRVITL